MRKKNNSHKIYTQHYYSINKNMRNNEKRENKIKIYTITQLTNALTKRFSPQSI